MSRIDDIQLNARIKLALITNPRVGGLEIGVYSVNRIVFLTGEVQDSDKKELAENIAKEQGALEIKNCISVLSDQLEEEIGIPFVNNTPSEDDVIIMERVEGALENDNRINSYLLNLEAKGGIVRISGIQNNDIAKMKAIEVAGKVQGVRTVIDNITVREAA
ncbi:MAG: BON domain-containing protein [Armatimonadota bacterium]